MAANQQGQPRGTPLVFEELDTSMPFAVLARLCCRARHCGFWIWADVVGAGGSNVDVDANLCAAIGEKRARNKGTTISVPIFWH